MIARHRTLNCDTCAEWLDIDDTETAWQARKRAAKSGWRVVSRGNGTRRDACPKCAP